MKAPKILFFIDGNLPTVTDEIAVLEIGVPVHYRNAQHTVRVDEECDGVAGAVPEPYKKHKTATEALEAYKSHLASLRANLSEVGGKPAKPKKSQEKADSGAKTGKSDKEDKPEDKPEEPKTEKPATENAAAAGWSGGK